EERPLSPSTPCRCVRPARSGRGWRFQWRSEQVLAAAALWSVRRCRRGAPTATRVANAAKDVQVAEELLVACRDGKSNTALQLLREKPERVREALLRPAAQRQLTPLQWACSRNLYEVVEHLTQHFMGDVRPSIDYCLFNVSRRGYTSIAELLIQRFPAEAESSAGRDVVEAARSGQAGIVRLLSERFPSAVRGVASEALYEACGAASAQTANQLLRDFPEEARASMDPNAADQTPLLRACQTGLVGVVRRLLEQFPEAKGALEVKDSAGMTPLAWACDNGHDAIVEMVLRRFPNLAEVAPIELEGEEELEQSPEMMQPKNRENMAKSGYRLVGSHSAVKQCRWTRNAILGQGQCYKHTFYGINSHQCMEATPSVACANKCTFCWRNHENPVATSWDFKMDDPDWIVQESIRNHLELVEEVSESPHALPDRVLAARSVRHVALSLVGEPVLYPKVAEFVSSLHKRRISTFFVTNGQFPDQLAELPWVTQLYVSLDAPDATTLRDVGRPLFRDYWDRLRRSLAVLREKHPKQRTVCRMTVLKGVAENDEACQGYADLINISQCDFVEIKAATYSPVWDKRNSGLSRDSIPRHDDVLQLARLLVSKLPMYGIAAEHEHSFCILLGRRDRFYEPFGARWRTWIDFDKFADAAEKGETLDTTDFAAETPPWALHQGTSNRYDGKIGFDPQEVRRFRRPMPRLTRREKKKLWPKHKMMVDVAVLTPQEGLDEAAQAQELLKQPHVRSVTLFEPVGTGHDEERVGVRYVAGDPDLNITYKEAGLAFNVDLKRRLSRLSKSQGGIHERERICQLVQPGERVLVKNEFALENIKANKLDGKVSSLCRNSLDVAGLGRFDRICAFLKFQALENLEALVSAMREGGTLHFYNHESKACPEAELWKSLGVAKLDAPKRSAKVAAQFLRAVAMKDWKNQVLAMLAIVEPPEVPTHGDPEALAERALAQQLGVVIHTVYLGWPQGYPRSLAALSEATGGRQFAAFYQPESRGSPSTRPQPRVPRVRNTHGVGLDSGFIRVVER
ncbi:TYW1, partial [Symbiodinium sp. CCMP2456]